MTDYHATLGRHRRLAILRFLSSLSTLTSNVSILTDVLNGADVGVDTSRDQTATELAWLAENGFVTLSGPQDFLVAKATPRGIDIGLGRASHPGIQRRST
ncbi:hypothetical protein LO749_06450 [Paracoccus denitrificans]|uniref:VpaChn25_0724 family phage protein n=1 Tax=Paracoccus denitrificans TaxID=266 RepID=UPI001E5C85AC|nr:hypothetical protein [Paracoccus denitrificans]UFS63827.1 hypothetical protein LO749_06450 [Paracoccus denitrificans]